MHIDIISNIFINLKKHIYQPEVHFFLFINQPSIPSIYYILCVLIVNVCQSQHIHFLKVNSMSENS
jgi:hypothetical protein